MGSAAPIPEGYVLKLSCRGRWFGWNWILRNVQGDKDPATGLYPPSWYRSGYTTTRGGAIREARRALARANRYRTETITGGGDV